MNLAHGGHLTHGHPLNFSGKYFDIVPYGVRQDDERIDYDEVARLAAEHAAEADHRRRQRLSARRSTSRGCGAIADDDRRAADGRHGAHRRAGRRRAASQPGAARRLRHHHHAQDAARAARRPDPVPRRPCQGDRPGALPGRAGRAADARHRRQGGVLQAGRRSGVRRLPAPGGGQRPRAGRRRWSPAGFRVVSGGTDNHLVLRRRLLARASPARWPRRRSAAPPSP